MAAFLDNNRPINHCFLAVLVQLQPSRSNSSSRHSASTRPRQQRRQRPPHCSANRPRNRRCRQQDRSAPRASAPAWPARPRQDSARLQPPLHPPQEAYSAQARKQPRSQHSARWPRQARRVVSADLARAQPLPRPPPQIYLAVLAPLLLSLLNRPPRPRSVPHSAQHSVKQQLVKQAVCLDQQRQLSQQPPPLEAFLALSKQAVSALVWLAQVSELQDKRTSPYWERLALLVLLVQAAVCLAPLKLNPRLNSDWEWVQQQAARSLAELASQEDSVRV